MAKTVYKIVKNQNNLTTEQEVQVAKQNVVHTNESNKIKLHISSKHKKNIDDMVLLKDDENLNIYFNDGTRIVIDKFYAFSDNRLLIEFGDREAAAFDSFVNSSDNMLIYGDESYAMAIWDMIRYMQLILIFQN